MAIDTGAYYYLFDPAFQIENNNGKPVVGGHVEVYYAGTDNKVITRQDFDGTLNPFKIPLKSDGRAVILVEIGKKYDAYVYDSFNNLVFSRLNIIPLTDASFSGLLSKVYHNDTLSGDGTPENPLSVDTSKIPSNISTSWPVVGDGTSDDPITIKDYRALAVDDTLTAYNTVIEGKESLVLGVNQEFGFMNETYLETDGDVITGYNGRKFAGEGGIEYTAGNNIDISNHIISVTGLENYASTADIPTAVSQLDNDRGYVTTADIPPMQTYTAGDHINIANNVISVTGLDEYALKTDIPSTAGLMSEDKLEYSYDYAYGNTYITGYDNKEIYPEHAVNAKHAYDSKVAEGIVNSYGYVINGDDVVNVNNFDYNSQLMITGYNGSAFATSEGKVYTGIYPIAVDNVKDEISVDSVPLIAGPGIRIDDNVISCIYDGDQFTAGNNISIDNGVISVTGLDAYATTADMSDKLDEKLDVNKLEFNGNVITGYDGHTFIAASSDAIMLAWLGHDGEICYDYTLGELYTLRYNKQIYVRHNSYDTYSKSFYALLSHVSYNGTNYKFVFNTTITDSAGNTIEIWALELSGNGIDNGGRGTWSLHKMSIGEGGGVAYTAGNNISIDNGIISVTGLDSYATTADLSTKLDTDVFNSEITAYVLKSDIPSTTSIMSDDKLEYNSDNNITGYNGSAFAGNSGHEYSGIDPIVVDNDTNTISAKSIQLVAGYGIKIENGVISIDTDVATLANINMLDTTKQDKLNMDYINI